MQRPRVSGPEPGHEGSDPLELHRVGTQPGWEGEDGEGIRDLWLRELDFQGTFQGSLLRPQHRTYYVMEFLKKA